MAQTLETIIAINATVGNGFAEAGNTLSVLGAQIDGMSQKLIDFGKDSVKTYEDYEKNMAAARVALSTIYGQDTKALNDVMVQLDSSARDWASKTIFHTDDVGNAITEAARAGWDYEQIMAGIPVAMQLAQAGSIDLSDALYYITESAKAGGIAFKDLGDFVDLWAFAANSSNGTVESFGDSLLKLGATMRFTDSKEELFSLIALMHDMGESGSTAATLLRTSMMRILAPSGVASGVMEELGATQEEIDAIREDAGKKEALNLLESYGFSAFDAEGQAKPILQIYSELGGVLAEIAGGYENITKNQTTLGVLGTIFGIKGITGALDIVTALEHAQELYDQMMNGDAVGYGAYAQETMMDTYFGDVETWESKVENLRLRTGEVLTAQLTPLLEIVGDITDNIASLDTGTFNAIIGGLEVLAGAGPGLLAAGGAFRLIGYALTPAGGIGLGLVALVAAANAINELEKADFASQFGDLELDSTQIQSYIKTLSDDFNSAYQNVNNFTQALSDAVTQYQTTSSTLKSSLISDMLTDAEIKEGSEEYEKLVGMGETMRQAIEDGINANYSALSESIMQSYGGDEGVTDNGLWTQIIGVLEESMNDELDAARNLGERFRKAITEAFSDGHLTGEELANIQSIIDEQNALLAQQQDREHYLERQSILRKAQTLGLDAIREASTMVEAERDAEWETLMQRQDAARYDVAAAYDKAIANGAMIDELALNPETGAYELTGRKKTATESDKGIALADLEQRQEAERYSWNHTEEVYEDGFDSYSMGLWTEGIMSSNLSGTWTALEDLANSVQEAGGYLDYAASNAYDRIANEESSAQAQVYLGEMIESLGGYQKLLDYSDFLERSGDAEMAQQFRNLLVMSDIFKSSGFAYPQIGYVGSPAITDGVDAQQRLIDEWNTQDRIDNLKNSIIGMRTEIADINENGLWQDMGNVSYQRSDEEAQARIQVRESEIAALQNELAGLYSQNGIGIPIAPYAGGNAVNELRDQGAQVQIDGDTTQLQATIDGADGQTLMTYVDGDATNLSATITAQDGRTLVENVTGDASSLASAIDQYRNQIITVTVRANTASIPTSVKGFAEGGRSDVPAIFGEGDTAEWAIPEEHSARTAELLNAARAASGFTWPELLGLYGGLNANPNGGQTTLVYSPTIYAQDATDVEQKLADDKARLEKWYEEKQMKEGLEVYT